MAHNPIIVVDNQAGIPATVEKQSQVPLSSSHPNNSPTGQASCAVGHTGLSQLQSLLVGSFSVPAGHNMSQISGGDPEVADKQLHPVAASFHANVSPAGHDVFCGSEAQIDFSQLHAPFVGSDSILAGQARVQDRTITARSRSPPTKAWKSGLRRASRFLAGIPGVFVDMHAQDCVELSQPQISPNVQTRVWGQRSGTSLFPYAEWSRMGLATMHRWRGIPVLFNETHWHSLVAGSHSKISPWVQIFQNEQVCLLQLQTVPSGSGSKPGGHDSGQLVSIESVREARRAKTYG